MRRILSLAVFLAVSGAGCASWFKHPCDGLYEPQFGQCMASYRSQMNSAAEGFTAAAQSLDGPKKTNCTSVPNVLGGYNMVCE